MKRLSRSEITDKFNSFVSQAETEDGAALEVMQELSLAIAELKDAGLDVSIDVFAWPNDLAFKLTDIEDVATMPFSGIINAAGQHYLFGITTELNDTPYKSLFLSETDIRYQGATKKVDSHEFYFEEGGDAIIQLQNVLIENCSRSAVIAKNDPGQVFKKTPDAQINKIIRKQPANSI